MRDGLEGMTLKERLAQEPGGLDADVALKVADGLLSELAAIQQAGRGHGNLTSGNVFLSRDGTVVLVDFEIPGQPPSLSQAADDVFAAGVVMHEALTGQVPRTDGDLRIRSSVKRVLSHADEVLQKALAEDPTARYPDAAAFRAALRQIRYREIRSATDAYRLLRVVGEGGFGCVYRARALGAGKFVAVKQLKRPEFGDRFRREAHVMRKLDDPAFVRLVDYFETKDLGAEGAFLVMDFLPGMPGGSLRDMIRRAAGAPLPFRDVIQAFECYARALALMHRLKIFHRDIKPSNLYFPDGDPTRAAIMDLGVARDISGTATQGQVPGTLDYMPPEVVLGGSRGDAGMDIYALGLCLYEAVSAKTGYPRLPTGSQAFSAFYLRAQTRHPPVFDAPVVCDRPKLLALLREMTALDPSERLQNAELLRRRLMEVAEEVPAGTRRLAPLPQTPPQVPVSSDIPSVEAPTGETSVVGRECPSPAIPRLFARRRLVIAGCAAAAVIALLGVWGPLLRGIATLRFRQDSANVPADERMADEGIGPGCPQAEATGDRQNEAVREQQELVKAFAGTSVSLAVCLDRVTAWREKWRGALAPAAYSNLERELSDATAVRKNREADAARRSRETEISLQSRSEPAARRCKGREGGERVVAECNRPLDNISLVGPDDVKNRTTVLPGDLDERVCETKAILPAYPPELLCLVDGIERKAGEVSLQRGRHVVKYFRREETYPGMKDYESKEYPFETRLSEQVAVPVPTGEWRPSAEFRRAREQAELAGRGRAIESECRRLLEPLPVWTRRERLEGVHAKLCDWRTSSALAALGVGVEKSLRSAYDAERVRVRGYVKNATTNAATVVTDIGEVAVPAGKQVLVTFEREWPSDARVVIAGFEFVMLPRDASAFDGQVFEIRPQRLVPIGVWDDPKWRDEHLSLLDGFRDAVDPVRRRELEDLKRAIELRERIGGKKESVGR